MPTKLNTYTQNAVSKSCAAPRMSLFVIVSQPQVYSLNRLSIASNDKQTFYSSKCQFINHSSLLYSTLSKLNSFNQLFNLKYVILIPFLLIFTSPTSSTHRRTKTLCSITSKHFYSWSVQRERHPQCNRYRGTYNCLIIKDSIYFSYSLFS